MFYHHEKCGGFNMKGASDSFARREKIPISVFLTKKTMKIVAGFKAGANQDKTNNTFYLNAKMLIKKAPAAPFLFW